MDILPRIAAFENHPGACNPHFVIPAHCQYPVVLLPPARRHSSGRLGLPGSPIDPGFVQRTYPDTNAGET